MTAPAPHSRTTGVFLAFTAFVCGAMVMVIEVLGSRVIGPFFGVSLFVWTALITVTLVALAAGYAVGGALCDRGASPDRLYAIVLAAAGCIVAVPYLRIPVIEASVPLGLRGGSLAAALVLFGPALFLLGCVSPWLVRIAAREMDTLGRTVGRLYALSTIGSFAGTVATGFYLVGTLGVDRIFTFAGLALAALAGAWFAAMRRGWHVATAALIVAGALLPPAPDQTYSRTLADGTTVTRVLARESFYGTIKVVDYRFGDRHTRELVIDGLVQGGVDVRTGLSVYEYSYLLSWLPRALHPDGTTCLVVGLGAGAVPTWYEAQGVRTAAVEIDPEVLAVARSHFGLPDGVTVHLGDARQVLASRRETYDYLVMDAFTGDTSPGHLLSREALTLVRERLTPKGVAAFNFHGSLGDDRRMTASFARTLAAVFDRVEMYPLFDPARGENWGNIVFVAYSGRTRTIDRTRLAAQPVHPLAQSEVRAALQASRALPEHPQSIVLTDDHNPLDLVDVALKERIRTAVLRTTDRGVLLR